MAAENIITIDGPAGSGKSTVAKILARELGLKYIDTGAMYRAITLASIKNNIDCNDEDSIIKLSENLKIEFGSGSLDERRYTKISINGTDVTEEIRSREVGSAVSIVSKLSGVRKNLVGLQRKLVKKGNAVLEGRDTGSVVYPEATLKIYLTADLKERINRRGLQVEQKGSFLKKEIIREEIISRDKIDIGRKDSPLVIPENGVVIDTTNMTIRNVVDEIKKLYLEKLNA
ncbi:MAG: (d)CMP kinase [Actinomycetota bacterium]|nr:(d)CMP kinase [Actinomycetota bacterium]